MAGGTPALLFLSRGSGGFGWGWALVIAFFVWTRDYRAGFEILFDQEFTSALGALFGNRLVGGRELALRIVRAPVECVALARLLLDQFAILAQRALHADKVLLHVLAIGIAGTGGELAIAAVTDHQIASAFRAGFVQRDVWHALALVQQTCGFAVGITRAGHELAEAAALEHHHATTVFAVFLLRRLLHIGGVEIGQVNGIFLGESAAFGIVLVVGTAGIEGPVLAPLDDERRAAALTLLVGGLLHTLDVLHVLLSVFEILGEAFVELRHGVGPLLFAFFDLVEFFFQAGGVGHVENVTEVVHEEVGDDEADLGGRKFSAHLGDVLALLDRAQDGGVGRGATNAALFQFLDQRGLVVARRRLGEVLLGLEFAQGQFLAGLERRELVLEFLVFFVLAFLGLFVDFQEAVELEDGSGYAEPIGVVALLGIDVDGGLIEDCGIDLRGDETLPDQFVDLELIFFQVLLDRVRIANCRGWANGFVRFLRAFLRLEGIRLLGQVLGTVFFAHQVAYFGQRFV